MPPDNPDRHIPDAISDLIKRELDAVAATRWRESLRLLPGESRENVLDLLEELISHSPKAAAVCFRQWPTASDLFSPQELTSWLDLGTTVASHSAAASLKYFRDSLPCLIRTSRSQVHSVLEMGLELADRNYGVVMDFLAAAPDILEIISPTSFSEWIEPGIQLAEADIVLAVEYFRITPALLNFISTDDLASWVRLGMRLVVPNQFGKPDYIRAIEYFRMSPIIFSSISPSALRGPFIELAQTLAEQSPQRALDFLNLGSEILQAIPSAEHRRRVLQHGTRLAARDPEVVPDYFRQARPVLDLVRDSLSDFDRWVETGYRLYAENAEKARAYFSQRSRMGQQTTEQIAGGLNLSSVARILQLYAEGLSGLPVRIRSSEELPEHLRGIVGSRPATDGRAIYLPERIRYFRDTQDNFRFYKVAILHEIGHLEFGTYDVDFSSVRDLIEDVRHRYGRNPDRGDHGDFAALFSLFPEPPLAKALWETLEDARIDFLIRWRYPGVRRDMDQVVSFELKARPSLEGLPPKRAVLEALTQLSVTDTTEVPLDLADLISKAYDLLVGIKSPEATTEDSLRLLVSLYALVSEWLAGRTGTGGESDPLRARENQKMEEIDSSSEEEPPMEAAPLSYRGMTDPDQIRSARLNEPGARIPSATSPIEPGAPRPSPDTGDYAAGGVSQSETKTDQERTGNAFQASPFQTAPTSDQKTFFYDEWDVRAQDYRPRFVKLVEKSPAADDSLFVQETISRYAGVVKLLRRYFSTLRPEAIRKLKRQTDGDDMDLDALLEARIEAASGGTHPDRVYIKTEKRERSVAVAFLLDVSGSTSQTIGQTGKKIIDVEKEGLVLLSEALQAVGDAYGIFGFSGKGHQQVEFFILKDFDEAPRPALSKRIGALQPMAQNRDGAAIRHCVHKLLQQPVRTRLLILISDGRPLDSDYTGDQATGDTKAALREAKIKGIHPYCITIDREANRYLGDLYGDVRYTIIDNVLSLPSRMPQIYKRLTT